MWCGRYGGCSAPAGIAFLYLIPYGAGIAACLAGPLGPLLAAPAGWLAEGILWLCRTLSRFPYAAAYVQNPALLVWAVAAVAAAVGLAALEGRRIRLWAALLAGGGEPGRIFAVRQVTAGWDGTLPAGAGPEVPVGAFAGRISGSVTV